MKVLAIELESPAEESVAQPRGILDDGIEDRLRVGVRPADDAEDLGRRSLLFGSLRQHALQLRVWHSGLAAFTSHSERDTAREAEVGVRRIVLLAPGTRQAEASQRPGRRKVGTVGRDYPPESHVVKNAAAGRGGPRGPIGAPGQAAGEAGGGGRRRPRR